MTDTRSQPKGETLPLCAICGASAKEPCTTEQQSKTCELPEFCWPNRAAPAGNAGVAATEEQIQAGARAMCSLNYLRQLRRVEYDGIDIREREHWEDLARVCLTVAAPQPREALADEIKRADAAPPEASFDNASDMLGYLNVPREAEPVTPITNPLVLPAGIKAGDYASPSPIPEAPGVREERPTAFLAWAVDMFGPVAKLRSERLLRFVEEAIELAHAEGMERNVLNLVAERVYSRSAGDTPKEIGQAQACLETFAENIGLSSAGEAQREWERVQTIPRDEWARRHSAKQAIGIALKPQDGGESGR